MPVEERKELLRREGRDRARVRSAAPGSLRAGERAQAHFLREFPPRRGMAIALYAAVPGEVPTGYIREACLAAGARIYYPRVEGQGTLAFFPHRVGEGWEEGPYGIPEPPRRRGTRPRAAGFDLVLVPGVAFDREGRRLGHGFGYYDRFLATLPAGVTRVGLAFRHQVIPEVPVDAWDVPVHALVTEEGVIRASHASGAPIK
jgi:5-formyltetrahydrofolate cyclo-ligase